LADKITWKLKLKSIMGTSRATKEKKDMIKEEVGEYIIDKILEDVSKLKSPVDMRNKRVNRKFDKLKKKYARFKKESGLNDVPNLEFSGLMLDSIEARPYRDGVEIGIFEGDAVPRADNHNKFSAKSKKTAVPKRQFIPKAREKFRPSIMKGIKRIAKEILREKHG